MLLNWEGVAGDEATRFYQFKGDDGGIVHGNLFGGLGTWGLLSYLVLTIVEWADFAMFWFVDIKCESENVVDVFQSSEYL